MTSNSGVHLGGAEVQVSYELLQEAADLAKDKVIAIISLNIDWDVEAYDCTILALLRRTDQLIERVSTVNSKTVVVTQAVCNVLGAHIIKTFLTNLCLHRVLL